MPCKSPKADGTPCEAPERMVDQETGFCPAHGPGAKERLSANGQKGAEALARKYRQGGISAEDLGPLETHADAQRWLRLIGAAVCSHQLGDRPAQAAVRAVAEWIKAESGRMQEEDLATIRAQLEELRGGGGKGGSKVRALR